jgi:hypothetical protein
MVSLRFRCGESGGNRMDAYPRKTPINSIGQSGLIGWDQRSVVLM